MQILKITFFSLLLMQLSQLYAQIPTGIVHLDSLSKEAFLNMDQQRLSMVKYKDSTVMLLRILSDNRFVAGLDDRPEGYEIFIRSAGQVNADCQEVRLERVTEKDDKQELHISVAIDYSGSMFYAGNNYVGKMQKAAQSFMDGTKGAYFTRANFDSYVDLINPTPTQTPKKVWSDNLDKYKKATALYDAIVDGVESLAGKGKNKFVVVFTDGIENSSGMSANTVIDLARKDSTKVIGISFGTAGELQTLRDICEQTNHPDDLNNVFYSANDIDEVRAYFNKLEHGVFGNYYRVISSCADSNFIAQELVIRNLESGDSIVLDIRPELAKVRKIDDRIFFGSVPFDLSKSTVSDRRYKEVLAETAEDIVNHLKAHPNDQIIIEGHASPEGEVEDNWLLSYERADGIDQLIKNHIKSKYSKDVEAIKAMRRISVEWYGPERPIFNVDSPFNRENRRVSIVLKEG